MSSENLMDATHPGEVDKEDLIRGTERAREWYEEAVLYVARLYVESAQRHPEVREAVVDGAKNPQTTLAKYDKETHEEIVDLGLSSYQGISAERLARKRLEDE